MTGHEKQHLSIQNEKFQTSGPPAIQIVYGVGSISAKLA